MANKPIRLIAGLGNPGPEYEQTAHNAGFWFIDEIVRRYHGQLRSEPKFHGEAGKVRIAGHECWLLKPTTFMNKSGLAVSALANYFKIDQTEIVVAHDELDFEPGTAKIKSGGGHGGHNGLRDIMPAIGKNFYRLRIGVGHPGDRNKVTGYLLGRAPKALVDGAMHSIDDILDVIEPLVAGDMNKVALNLHSKN